MNILEKIRNVLKDAFVSGWSVSKLAQSFCMGVYIAFSPFPGAHTVMMFIATWLFKLNFPILFVATSLNNPWTMIPFFTFDYLFGYWFLHDFIGWNPGYAFSLEKILTSICCFMQSWIGWSPGVAFSKVFGSGEICLVSFLIGGNILGIVSALLFYPVVSRVFKRLVERFQKLQNV